MSLEDRAKATAKNVEGKVQEAVGNVTGDPKTQAEGKAKQAEAEVRNTVEDVKDEAKKIINKQFSIFQKVQRKFMISILSELFASTFVQLPLQSEFLTRVTNPNLEF